MSNPYLPNTALLANADAIQNYLDNNRAVDRFKNLPLVLRVDPNPPLELYQHEPPRQAIVTKTMTTIDTYEAIVLRTLRRHGHLWGAGGWSKNESPVVNRRYNASVADLLRGRIPYDIKWRSRRFDMEQTITSSIGQLNFVQSRSGGYIIVHKAHHSLQGTTRGKTTYNYDTIPARHLIIQWGDNNVLERLRTIIVGSVPGRVRVTDQQIINLMNLYMQQEV